ncbi:aryl-sulfate sulfotransferase, partial [Candidatus Marinimicrobia bacterium]|nr:aryl-sulfate sulfotransferase [Candidatus Neomarinimicrobiota bacterium]
KLIDNNFNVINEWISGSKPASMAYLLPDSTLLYPCRKESPSIEVGAMGGRILKYDWEGNVLWDWTSEEYDLHHDIEPLPNGNILAIGIETISEGISTDVVLEVRPFGVDNAEILWEWHVWDHRGSDNPFKFDENTPYEKEDWNHFNSIHLNNNGDKIYLSSRKWSEFYIIGYRGDSDILYRWGNPQNYGRGSESDRLLYGNHGVNEILSGYPGSNNILIFNNNPDLYNFNSHVLEISPPIDDFGNYYIGNNEPFGPISSEWTYVNDFYSGKQSGAFRLPNGNTLITSATEAYIFEVSNDGEIVWEFRAPGNNAQINRAQKYDILYFNTLGDINNDELINILDIVLLSRFILGLDIPSVMEFKTSDYNDDEVLDILDVVSIVSLILNI